MSYQNNNGTIFDTEDGQIVATMSESATPEQALLLVAARDLLAALKLAVSTQAYRDGHGPEWWESARAAIAKATGATA